MVIDPIYEDGRLVGFAKITRDITERRESQLKLEQMQKHLAEAQKLDALGQLTGGVAHDFNNILMVISGSLHFLRKSASDDPQGTARDLRDRNRVQARRGADQPAADLCPAAERQSPADRCEPSRIEAIREVLETGVGSTVRLAFEFRPRSSGR